MYYCIITLPPVFWSVVGGSVINDAYKQLYLFEQIEKEGKLAEAKLNPSIYDKMLQVDIKQFASTKEFKDDIYDRYEGNVDQAEAITIGLLFAIISELSTLFILSLKRLFL